MMPKCVVNRVFPPILKGDCAMRTSGGPRRLPLDTISSAGPNRCFRKLLLHQMAMICNDPDLICINLWAICIV